MKSSVGAASPVRARVYNNELDWSSFISFESPVSGPKLGKNKIILFYSFLTLTFTFSGTKGLFAPSLLHLSGTKGPYVFFTFALAFFKCLVVNTSGQGGLSSLLKVKNA